MIRIFLDPVNREIAGPDLSLLTPDGVIRTLEFLVQLHLLEGTGRDAENRTIFTAHPAVREGFLSTVDQETARHTHDAARRDIVASLDPAQATRLDLRPGERYPRNRQILDRLEELIHHSLESGYTEEAYELYNARIGGSRNLAAALGDYERGARLCASLLAERAPHQDYRRNPDAQALLYVDWAVYLAGLGQVDRALECFEHEARLARKTPRFRATDISRSDDIAGLHLLAGRLATTVRLASGNLRSGVLAHAHALRGDVSEALYGFQFALPNRDWRPSAALLTRAPLFSLPALYHCLLLARLGPTEEAARATAYVKADIASALASDRHMYDAPANLILAELAAQKGDFVTADAFVADAHDWALERGAREILGWAALTRARVANAKARQNETSSANHVTTAIEACRTGLRIARESGFAIYHADLALELAQALLYQGDHQGAINTVKGVLFGHQPVDDQAFAYDAPPRDEATPPRERLTDPPKASGLPRLLAATHPECNYAWAEGLGLHLLAEASALAAASEIGTTKIDVTGGPISENLRQLMTRAAQYANEAMSVFTALRDPRWNDTHAFASRLERGELTSYPVVARATTSVPKAAAAGPRVFISYAHADNENSEHRHRWLDRLLQHLAPLVQRRELSIWSDHDLRMGDSWHDEIGRSLDGAIAAVLLVSPAFLASSYIRNSELPVLLKKGHDVGLVIIPILLRPCLFIETQFSYPDPVSGPDTVSLASLQTANMRAKPLSAMSETEQDETLVAVARHLLKVVQARR
jgi:hypothetical protein